MVERWLGGFCEYLRGLRRRFAGAEPPERGSHVAPKIQHERVLAAEHAPRGPFRLLEHLQRLLEILERGSGVTVEKPPVVRPQL